jgi:hypothetical protein
MEKQIIPLEANGVSISTATVTIKALTVGKKQMTMGVFRQLEPCIFVDETNLTLNGEAWGWVNYHWGDLAHRTKHFLVQQGEVLRRSPFWVRRSGRFAEFHDPYHPDIDWWPHGIQSIYQRYQRLARALGYLATASLKESKDWHWSKTAPNFSHKFRFFKYKLDSHDLTGNPDDLRNKANALVGELAVFDELEQAIHRLGPRIDDYCRRWDALMERLDTVEQLFIAV